MATKQKKIISYAAREKVAADMAAIADDLMAAVATAGLRGSAYGGRIDDTAHWKKTPGGIEVPDTYVGVDVMQDGSGMSWSILSIYVQPVWSAIERGMWAYEVTFRQGGQPRNSKLAPYLRQAVQPGQDVTAPFMIALREAPRPRSNPAARWRKRACRR